MAWRGLTDVVAVSLPEGGQERLRDDVLGEVRTETTRHIPADAPRVAVEDQGELIRLKP